MAVQQLKQQDRELSECIDNCSEAVEACRDECARFDMDHCQTCAEVLEPCIESCRAMAQ